MKLAMSVQSIASAERAVALMTGHYLRSMRVRRRFAKSKCTRCLTVARRSLFVIS